MSWRSRESTTKADASIATADAPRAPAAGAGGAFPGLLMAVAAPLAITALELAWPEQLGYATPFLLYFAAILLGAWAGGLLGGSVSVLLSALLGSYFFLEPHRTLARGAPEAWLGPAIFVLEGLVIAWLTARVRTGRAQALARARETQLLRAQLEGVLASVDDAVSVQDPHGTLIYANQPAAALTGYPNAAALVAAPLVEVMGRFELRAADGSAFPMAELPSRKALQGLPAPEQLVRFRLLASGEERWLLLRAAPVTLPGGELQYAVNVFRDLTELHQREEALRVSQARFASALQGVGDAVITTDAQGAVTFMNPTAERLSGWTSAEASGKPLAEVFQIVDETTRVKLESPVARALRDGNPAALAQRTVLITRQGSELAIDESRAAPIPSGDGPAAGAVLLFRDVTHRRVEERDVAKARAEIERASRAKDEFLAALGRELREPLAPIVGALQQLQGDEAEAPEARAPEGALRQREPIAVIERQVRHMVTLADHLLDVARITGGKLELVRERSALNAVVAKAVELAGPSLAERQHALVVVVPDDLFVE